MYYISKVHVETLYQLYSKQRQWCEQIQQRLVQVFFLLEFSNPSWLLGGVLNKRNSSCIPFTGSSECHALWVSEFLLSGTADVPLTGWASTGTLQKYLGDIAWHYFTSTQGCRLCAEPIYHCITTLSCCMNPVWITGPSTCLPHQPSPVPAGDIMVGTSLGEWEKWLNSPDSKTIWVDT